ncbi:MAG TPA: metalloregulator ArsR/SmtB family transcription factor [Candidatus Methylacidiphilales bacterium]|nr:metalloregulator ArsR/SmtB family transcription factor [Candidatus Methylacidiphilales bacterium]
MSFRALWQTLHDPTRLRILALLEEEELSVAELQAILHLGQSRISTHLAHLRRVGLVDPRREGKRTYYSLVKKLGRETRQILDSALLTLAEVPGAKTDPAGLKLVLEKRRSAAREYFNRVAGRLGKNFCPGRTWAEIGPLLAQLVPRVTVADLGAGEGWLSQLLARRAGKVIAVDNSPKMVAFGRAEAKKKGIANLDYRLGDLADPPIPARSIDLVILSQALHHAANPQQAVAAAARLLRKGGRLVILDLNQHHFDQARELYGDYWLGFSEADLRAWLAAAGLQQIDVQLLAPEPEPPHFQPALASGVAGD